MDDDCVCRECGRVWNGESDAYRERNWARNHGGFWVPEMGEGLCPAHV